MQRVLLVLLVLFLPTSSVFAADKLQAHPFGEVYLYPPAAIPPTNCLIMVSGDGGWVKAVVELAEVMSKQGSMVIGIDISQYLKNLSKEHASCLSPAADLQMLTKIVATKYGIRHELNPILIGYSSGATLVYATFVQAPQNFRAAFSFGFCPDFALTKSFCAVNGLEWALAPRGKEVFFQPAHDLQSPWIVFQGLDDQVCNPEITRNFVGQVPAGRIILLPRVGHGFAKLKNWLPQFKAIINQMHS